MILKRMVIPFPRLRAPMREIGPSNRTPYRRGRPKGGRGGVKQRDSIAFNRLRGALRCCHHTRPWGGTKPLNLWLLQLCNRESSSIATRLVVQTICEATSALLQLR